MDWSWDKPLKPDQRSNPVMHIELVDLDEHGVAVPTDAELEQIFRGAGYRLQTWNRSADSDGKKRVLNDPHWLAVRGGTPLHVDPRYPRFSHQLKVRVDTGIYVRGFDREETMLRRGTFYILDTHSPHQVFHKDNTGAWNVTASIDHNIMLNPASTLKRLLEYVKGAHILDGAPTVVAAK